MARRNSGFWLAILPLALSGALHAQSPRVLYTWGGTGKIQDWRKSFGTNLLTLENTIDGELTVTETGDPAGAGSALSDEANVIAEGAPTVGGLDLTGLTALEFDLGHNGTGPVSVQFFAQATPAFNYVVLGPGQDITPGVNTFSVPLADLTPVQITYIRVLGINIFDHPGQGNLVWTLREVRSVGSPLGARDIANHDVGSSDNGLQGAVVNFDNGAVEGNDGGQNQTGLAQNTSDLPPGNNGSLEWVDLASGNGAAVTWANGTIWNGNTFNERPVDLASYTSILIRMAATNREGGVAASVGVQYFLQTGNYEFHVAGSIQDLPADGEFHELSFAISAIPNLEYVVAHGVNLLGHPSGDLVIDVDFVRGVGGTPITDCNKNGLPDERDLAEGKSKDCNSNHIPDECDIAAGVSQDCNKNGVPDQCELAGGPVERSLYTWQGTGDVRGWMKLFGANDVALDNNPEGELTATETGASAGAGVALSDGFNGVAEGSPSQGGLDLTGATALLFDMGHNGTGAVQAQFFVQATPSFDYVALGPDQGIEPGVKTYTAPLKTLTAAQLTYIRTIGINIRDHLGEGNLQWTLREVRAVQTPLTERDYATHEAGTSDNGLQGAVVSFEQAAVEGNDGGQNQTGLRVSTSAPPAGNTGSLQWTDIANMGGAQVSWFNGTVWKLTTFNERPTDMSAYTKVLVRLAATNSSPGAVEAVDVVYFLQTANFNYHQAGPAQSLPADGQFHELVFPIADIPDRLYVDGHGLDLQEHPGGDLIIDVDRIRAIADGPAANDCNGNGVPDDCDIAGGLKDLNKNGVPDICEPARFKRGDANNDDLVDLSDGVYILNLLFLGGTPLACPDAGNLNGDASTDISDPVSLFSYLFLGGPAPAMPFPECGADPGGSSCPESVCNH